MNRLIRLVILGILGMAGVAFYARTSVSACLHSMGLGNTSMKDQRVAEASANYDSILFTEWLAGDVFKLSLLPLWSSSEGSTAETMRAYAELHEARQDGDALVEESKRSIKHLQAKDHLFQQLVAQEIHLIEAATGWLEEDRRFGRNQPDIMSKIYPGKTPTERYCRRLIWQLEQTAQKEPARLGPVLIRARTELRLMTEPGKLLTAN